MESSASAEPTNPNAGEGNPSAAAPAATLPNIPTSWPGAFGVYKYSKQAVMLNLGALVIIWVINFVLSGIVEAIFKSAGGFISLLISSLFTAAYVLVYLASVRGQRLAVGDAISQAVSFWLKMIGLLLLVGISLVVSFLLLIVPFFFVLPRLSLAHYFLIDKKMGIMDAYKASWNATQGHVGQVWGIIGATIAMALLMITIIGIPFSIYFLVMYSAAIAILYEFLNKAKPAVAPAPAAPVK